MNEIIERIERKAGVPDLVSILAERLTPTDLQSLLLAVFRVHSSQLTPAAVLSNYETNRFVRPSTASPTQLVTWEQVAFSQLPQEFKPLALSPVCPLGTNSVVASVAQDWAIATARTTEVVSDSTNVLALECAVKRRDLLRLNPKSADTVHLATSHRLLRAQHYQNPDMVAHFSSFALCSAGRDQGNLQFEFSTLRLHIGFYLRALGVFLGSNVPLQLMITDFNEHSRMELLEHELLAPLRVEFENVACGTDEQRTSGRGYYLDLCFHIYVVTSDRRWELVDGGVVNWTQKYLSNAKERLVISGIGSERLVTEFGKEKVV